MGRLNLNLPKEKIFVGPAMLWKRIAAFLMDMLIINLIVLFPFRILFEDLVPKNYSFSEAYKFLSSVNYTSYLSLLSLVVSILIVLYFVMMEKKMGQTIGKMVFRIYVVSDNNNLKTWQLLVRNLAFIPIFPFVLLWILDPSFMFFTKTNQRLTEILSKTKVMEKYSFEQESSII
ncbi:RDD family protein [Candidatus Woesearchaeota archaeon]|nr:RDD family protein [Candidatus Woesearchaeota archaeon]